MMIGGLHLQVKNSGVQRMITEGQLGMTVAHHKIIQARIAEGDFPTKEDPVWMAEGAMVMTGGGIRTIEVLQDTLTTVALRGILMNEGRPETTTNEGRPGIQAIEARQDIKGSEIIADHLMGEVPRDIKGSEGTTGIPMTEAHRVMGMTRALTDLRDIMMTEQVTTVEAKIDLLTETIVECEAGKTGTETIEGQDIRMTGALVARRDHGEDMKINVIRTRTGRDQRGGRNRPNGEDLRVIFDVLKQFIPRLVVFCLEWRDS